MYSYWLSWKKKGHRIFVDKVINDNAIYYGGYHKIKHFAWHRDFFVHEIPLIKHTQNIPYPGIKHFSSYHKIKHFACHRDSFVPAILCIKHTQNSPYPGIKHFSSFSIMSHSFQSHSLVDESLKMLYTLEWNIWRMYYTWSYMHNEISVTSKMFYFYRQPRT